jgi:DNA polymerase-3 subunit epsilon
VIILGLDFETTWTDPVNSMIAQPLEIGAVLYDVENKKVLKVMSEFLTDRDHPPSPIELVKLTGITDEMRQKYGMSPQYGLLQLNSMMFYADYIVAHNGREFDKNIYEQECARRSVVPVEKHWIDTKLDLPLPESIKTTKLTYLAAEHGFANPFAHRALFDVLTMIKVMENYPFSEVYAMSLVRDVKIMAEVSYAQKDQASSRGFFWDKENKRWLKSIKENKFQQLKEDYPFNIVLINKE